MAFVVAPAFVGELGLRPHRDVVVAIGQLGHHGTGNAGIGLRHQALQFGRTRGQTLALVLELLAVIILVFGGIDERPGGKAVTEIGATGQPDAGHEQRHRRGGAQQRPGTGMAGDHRRFVTGQH